MANWPKEYDPSAPLNRYERREVVRNGFAELLPSYNQSLAAVRRGKKRTSAEDQKSQLNSCERDLTCTLKIISSRAKEAYYGDVLELSTGVESLLSEKELKSLRMVRHLSIRETAQLVGLSHVSVLETVKTAVSKISKARYRLKNPIIWFLTDQQTMIWELLQSELAGEKITEMLKIDLQTLEHEKGIIRRATQAVVIWRDNGHHAVDLSALSPDQRLIHIFALKHKDSEIAEILGKSPATIKTQRARIRTKLQMVNKTPTI